MSPPAGSSSSRPVPRPALADRRIVRQRAASCSWPTTSPPAPLWRTSNVNLTSLSLTGTGTLDIGNNRIIIDYSTGNDPIASIESWINNGYYGTAGPAIISSDITADDAASGLSYGIGYADGADGAVAGLPSGEIEIMFTLLGDANLDGTVNSEDFTPFSTNIGQPGVWDQGDFNYDGTVNTEDFTPFSHNLGQSASLAAAAGAMEDQRTPSALRMCPNPVARHALPDRRRRPLATPIPLPQTRSGLTPFANPPPAHRLTPRLISGVAWPRSFSQ